MSERAARGRPLRVALVSASAHHANGWGRFTDSVCREFAKRPAEIDFTLHLPRDSPALDVPYADRIRFDLPRFTPSFARRGAPRLAEYLLAPRSIVAGSELTHSLVDFPYAWLTARLAKRAGIPYVITGQGTYLAASFQRWPDRDLLRSACRDAAAVTVPSRYTEQRFHELAGLSRACTFLPNGVDHERFAAPPPHPRAPNGRRTILTIGAHKRRKGFDVLLDGFARISAAFPDVDLEVIGPGDPSPLRAQAQALGVADRVHIRGEVADVELTAAIHACAVFALTPRVVDGAFEGFGLVYLEASAAGKPIVASASGGVPDAVVDDETGILVPEGDARATGEALARVLTDTKLAELFGANGRVHARRHDWSRYADSLLALYRGIRAAGGAP